MSYVGICRALCDPARGDRCDACSAELTRRSRNGRDGRSRTGILLIFSQALAAVSASSRMAEGDGTDPLAVLMPRPRFSRALVLHVRRLPELLVCSFQRWGDRRESNPLRSAPQADACPFGIDHHGGPARNLTPDTLVWSESRGHHDKPLKTFRDPAFAASPRSNQRGSSTLACIYGTFLIFGACENTESRRRGGAIQI